MATPVRAVAAAFKVLMKHSASPTTTTKIVKVHSTFENPILNLAIQKRFCDNLYVVIGSKYFLRVSSPAECLGTGVKGYIFQYIGVIWRQTTCGSPDISAMSPQGVGTSMGIENANIIVYQKNTLRFMHSVRIYDQCHRFGGTIEVSIGDTSPHYFYLPSRML